MPSYSGARRRATRQLSVGIEQANAGRLDVADIGSNQSEVVVQSGRSDQQVHISRPEPHMHFAPSGRDLRRDIKRPPAMQLSRRGQPLAKALPKDRVYSLLCNPRGNLTKGQGANIERCFVNLLQP